jgi:uncharacterized protein (TIGR02147 family)
MKHLKISIYNYTDFRLYLKHFYQESKKTCRGFSFRKLSEMLGFNSPNFIQLVINGKRNISKDSIEKISSGIGLKSGEKEYFKYLVLLKQSKSEVEKNFYFGLISKFRFRKNLLILSDSQFEYIEDWITPLLREYLRDKPTTIDLHKLVDLFYTDVTLHRIKKSIKVLLKLGMLTIDENGRYRQSAPFLSTENDLSSLAVRKYHKDVLSVAQQALDHIKVINREFNSMTVTVSKKGLNKIKKKLQDYKTEISQIVKNDTDTNTVCHINMQMYPLLKDSELNSIEE